MIIHPDEIEALGDVKRPLVFTNGVFDILHRGHVAYLQEARRLGQSLVVAVNSDYSVKMQNKGPERPLNTLGDRLALLDALQCVDVVTWFAESEPTGLVRKIRPDILVKGGDYANTRIAGAQEVRSWGGCVVTIPFEHQRSTTALIERIRASGLRPGQLVKVDSLP